MKNRAWWILGCIVLGGILWQVHVRNSEYGGKNLEAWCKQIEQWDNARKAEKGRSVSPIATNAIPALIKILESEPTVIKNLIEGRNIVLGDQIWHHKNEACHALSSMGNEATPAIPALSNLLINLGEAGVDPAATLANIGENGLPVLIAAVTNKDRTIRYCAVDGLQFEKAKPSEAVAILSKALRDSDLGVRLQAVASLESLNAQRELTMSALREAAKDPSLSDAANLAIKEMTDGIEGLRK